MRELLLLRPLLLQLYLLAVPAFCGAGPLLERSHSLSLLSGKCSFKSFSSEHIS